MSEARRRWEEHVHQYQERCQRFETDSQIEIARLYTPEDLTPRPPSRSGKGELPYLTRSHLTLPLSVYGEGTGEVEGQRGKRGRG
jgi:hypothetical protein